MSNFTKNYINAIDYDFSLKRRLENYKMLREMLSKYNKLQLDEQELTYMYPLLVDSGNKLRNYLKENNIYAIKLWPNVLWNGANQDEINRVDNMILLPIDQRYSINEMNYIISTIDKYYYKSKRKVK
jgi:dTDP-4-amino-4,6-dideoxygalactose transaminase